MPEASGKGGAALYIYNTDLLRTLGIDLTNKKHLKKAKDLHKNFYNEKKSL